MFRLRRRAQATDTPGSSEDVCPVCRDTPKDIFVTSCGHAFCGLCICRYVFFRAARGSQVPCPACRQALTRCETTACVEPTGDDFLVTLQLGRISLLVDVHQGKVTQRITSLLRTPASRLKLIYKGKVLKSDSDVRTLVTQTHTSKPVITLLPRGALPDQPWIRTLLQRLRALILTLYAYLTHLTRPLRRLLQPCGDRCWQVCQPVVEFVRVFVRSMNPGYAVPGSNPQTNSEPQDAAIQNRAS